MIDPSIEKNFYSSEISFQTINLWGLSIVYLTEIS